MQSGIIAPKFPIVQVNATICFVKQTVSYALHGNQRISCKVSKESDSCGKESTELTPSLFQGGPGWVQLSMVTVLVDESLNSNAQVYLQNPLG